MALPEREMIAFEPMSASDGWCETQLQRISEYGKCWQLLWYDHQDLEENGNVYEEYFYTYEEANYRMKCEVLILGT